MVTYMGRNYEYAWRWRFRCVRFFSVTWLTCDAPHWSLVTQGPRLDSHVRI